MALGALALASPVLAWVLIGDVSDTDLPNPDYMFQPPEVSTSVGFVVVAVAVVLVTCGGATLLAGFRRGLLATMDLMAAALLLGAGIVVGFAGRVMTARVIGANIGGGIMLMFGPFIVAGLLAFSAVLWRRQPR